MSKEQRLQRRTNELRQILETIALDDARISKAAGRALSVAPDVLLEMRSWKDAQLKNAGWTREEYETAWEARKPMAECSYAVRLAHERTGMRIRQSVDRGGMTVNVANIIMPAPQGPTAEQKRTAPVIDVSPGEK